MEYSSSDIIGRVDELGQLSKFFEKMKDGEGGTVLVSGEAGVGKTRLIDEFLKKTDDGVDLLVGEAEVDNLRPFLMFSNALGDDARYLFETENFARFLTVFVVDESGSTVAQASSDDKLNADVLANMLKAVQDFVRDSFDSGGPNSAGLGRMSYGHKNIIARHGNGLLLAAVFEGDEHPQMETVLRSALDDLSGGGGHQSVIDELASRKFPVKKSLEGVKLEGERTRIADGVLERLGRMSEERPLLMVLRDLHWADESSLFVLNYLARNITSRRIMLLGTMRPVTEGALAEMLDAMTQDELHCMIPLSGLGRTDFSALIDDMFPDNDFPAGFLEKIGDKCEGNPFFLIELLKSMWDDGSIVLEYGKYSLASKDFFVPATVEDLVKNRIDGLEPDALAMAEFASCIGREFEKRILFSINTVGDRDGALEKLTGSGIMLAYNGNAGFSHAIYQDVIYSSIEKRWLTGYHRLLGEVFEADYLAGDDDAVYHLAKHFPRTSEHNKAFDYSIMAGEKAERSFAAEQAVEFYETAISVMEKMNLGDEDAKRRVDIYLHIGQNLQLLGNWDEAEGVYKRALGLAEEVGEKGYLARTKSDYGRLLWRKGDHDDAFALLMSAHSLFSELDDRKMQGRLLGHLGDVEWGRGEYEKAMKHYRGQYDLGLELGNNELTGSALGNIGQVLLEKGEYDDALAKFKKELALSDKSENKKRTGDTLGNIGNAYCYKGDYPRALDYFKKQLAIVEDIKNKAGICRVVGNMGVLYFSESNYEEARRNYERQLEIAEELGDKYIINIALGNIGELDLETGRYDDAMIRYGRKLAIAEKLGDKLNTCVAAGDIGRLFEKQGDEAKALEYLDRAVKIGRVAKLNYFLAGYLYFKGRLAFRTGDYDTAGKLNAEALKLAGDVGRSDIAFEAKLLNVKLNCMNDGAAAEKAFSELLAETSDDTEKAALNYELFMLTGNEKNRLAAVDLYTAAFKIVPKIIYKERIEEMAAK